MKSRPCEAASFAGGRRHLGDARLDRVELDLIGVAMRERSLDRARRNVCASSQQPRAARLLQRLGRFKRGRASWRFELPELKLMRVAVLGRQHATGPAEAVQLAELAALVAKLGRLLRVKAATLLDENRVRWASAIPYFAFNAAAVAGVFVYPPRPRDLALCLALYLVRMFAVGGGLHRYFSHRSYSTSRAFQLALALVCSTVGQQGPLWWASAHRHHHRTSDTPEDFHSPSQRGFLWAHQLWPFTDRAQRTDFASVRDLSAFPELRWLDRFWLVPHLALVGILLLCGGLRAVEWGFFVSTVLLWQMSFTVNSTAHLFGSRRFDTADTSTNSWVMALLTLGDGWHNNHHHYPGSMRAGFYWWEVDLTACVIRGLGRLGLVWDIREPPAAVIELGRTPLALRHAAAAAHEGEPAIVISVTGD